MPRKVHTPWMYVVFSVLALVLIAAPLSSAQPGDGSPRVLASTAWTAAIAEAAGAQNVDLLAPFELRHPPEQDFRPSDITRALAADVIVWGGYEAFVSQLVAAAGIPQERVLQIPTQNAPDHLIDLTRDLAARWGTEERQREWEAGFRQLTDSIYAQAQAHNVSGQRVVVVGHMVPFVTWLGYEIVGTFGFDEMTPARIHALASLEPDLIIDVWHNPTAEAIAEAAGVPYILLINFPGKDGTRNLRDVFIHNARELGLWPEE